MGKLKKTSKEIRLLVRDEASDEVVLNEYLHNSQACPYPYREMVILALKAFWLPFAYKCLGASTEQLRKATIDSIYQLQRHLNYLYSQIGFELEGVEVMFYHPIPPQFGSNLNTSVTDQTNASAPIDNESSVHYPDEADEDSADEWVVPFEFTNKLGT